MHSSADASRLPPLRNFPQLRVGEPIREEVGEGLGQAQGRVPPSWHVGTHGVEIDEPGLEQRPRQRLQRLVRPLVQLDLVVQHPPGLAGSRDFRKMSCVYSLNCFANQ